MLVESSAHPIDDELESYCLDLMPESALAAVEEHLLVCEECRVRLSAAEGYVNAMRAACGRLRGSEREKPWSFLRWAPALAFAGLVLIAVLAGGRLEWWGAAPPVAVNLVALRGPSVSLEAPAGRLLDLTCDLTGLPRAPEYRVQFVDAAGRELWNSRHQPQGESLRATVPLRPLAGQYFVRVYLPDGELLREFGLNLRTP